MNISKSTNREYRVVEKPAVFVRCTKAKCWLGSCTILCLNIHNCPDVNCCLHCKHFRSIMVV